MGTYVYAVCEGRAAVPDIPGIGGALREIDDGNLCVIAGDAPEVPVRPSRRNLKAHQEVLESLQDRAVVLPMRFGQVFPGDEEVRGQLLTGRRDRLLRLLRRVRGHVELDVKLRYDDDGLLARAIETEASGALARAIEALETASMAERVRLGELCAGAVDRTCAADGARVLTALRARASENVVRSAGKHQEPFCAAFLVRSGAEKDFDQALGDLSSSLPGDVKVECIGPLLPFAFVDLEGG